MNSVRHVFGKATPAAVAAKYTPERVLVGVGSAETL